MQEQKAPSGGIHNISKHKEITIELGKDFQINWKLAKYFFPPNIPSPTVNNGTDDSFEHKQFLEKLGKLQVYNF